jgi:hypothetical protein
VGQRTGRTEGIVIKTNHREPLFRVDGAGDWLTDQVLATYASEAGDSGAPVLFLPFSTRILDLSPLPTGLLNVFLLGIHSGATTISEDTVQAIIGEDLDGIRGETVSVGRFSPIANVEAELGPLNTCVPQNPC